MKIAVSSYSYKQKIQKGEMTQLDAIRVAKEQGFDGIEFTDLKPVAEPTLAEQLAYAKELREEAARVGIEIVAYLVGAMLYNGSPAEDQKAVERLIGQLDVAATLGAKIFRHDVCWAEQINGRVVSFEQMLLTIAENARKVSDYAATLGNRTCSENHGFVVQDSDRVERLYNTVRDENYGILVDMGNFACVDEDSIRAVSRLAPYAVHAHAKDFLIYPFDAKIEDGKKYFESRGCNKLMGCAIGDGNIPIAQCISILKKAKYDGYISIEFEGNGDCISEIAKGLARIREYVKN